MLAKSFTGPIKQSGKKESAAELAYVICKCMCDYVCVCVCVCVMLRDC